MKKFLAIFAIILAISSTVQARNFQPTRISDLRFQDFFLEIQSGNFTQSMQNSLPISFDDPEHDLDFDLPEENLTAWRSNFSDGFVIFFVDNGGSIQSILVRRSIESENPKIVDAVIAILLKNIGLSSSDFVTLAEKKSVVRNFWCDSIERRLFIVTNGFTTSISASKN